MHFATKYLVIALFLVLSLAFLGASCFKSSTSNSGPVKTSSVTIKNLAFRPQVISISAGTVVTWKNEDSVEHQITSDGDLADLLSGILEPNDTFSFTFNQAGTWKYHCNIHPNMTGQVIVK